ncbi:hypothetical protein EDD22DRAFT_950618 [Suillus occidentalis]|nr:hypothetical protein EDD22DRAFT_950618 [Suillus occidentalis]
MKTEIQEFITRSDQVDSDGLYDTQSAVIPFQMVNQYDDVATESGQGANGRQVGIAKMPKLEHDANIRREVQTLTIGQREQFVIIQPTSIMLDSRKTTQS